MVSIVDQMRSTMANAGQTEAKRTASLALNDREGVDPLSKLLSLLRGSQTNQLQNSAENRIMSNAP